MHATPEFSLLVSTFERPEHLELTLLSIASQRGADGLFEVVVTDDGSRDRTPRVVEDFARSVDFPVRWLTHEHQGFQLARCRNEGVRAARAPYLLFLDGDLVLPPDHLRRHLQVRRPGVVFGGDCCRLDEATSRRVSHELVRAGRIATLAPRDELRRLAGVHRKARLYNLLRHPTRPKLFGGTIAIWKQDYERVNGYDERFEGWGCEDDDLRLRLKKAGLRIESILGTTFTYHVWHPPHATTPRRWREGRNVEYLRRAARLTRCRRGLVALEDGDLRIRIHGEGLRLPPPFQPCAADQVPEVEIIACPSRRDFDPRTDVKILVVPEGTRPSRRQLRRAALLVGDGRWARPHLRHFPPGGLEAALRSLL
ncbi:MAG: glycosyltransferase [Acidobacteriota bacterium]|nr:glycosyltransferase [Acidobacteriota bacterium]MDQ7086574.1 glycosyltransferase [Acidobacteriota bacterium]